MAFEKCQECGATKPEIDIGIYNRTEHISSKKDFQYVTYFLCDDCAYIENFCVDCGGELVVCKGMNLPSAICENCWLEIHYEAGGMGE